MMCVARCLDGLFYYTTKVRKKSEMGKFLGCNLWRCRGNIVFLRTHKQKRNNGMSHTKDDLLRMGIVAHEIRHSQHRRAQWADYNGVGLYMVTLCVEGRSAVFGRLEGDIRATRGTEAFPHLVPTELGRVVLEEEIRKIHTVFPQVEVWQVAMMPDHIHLLLYIREPLPAKKRLGNVVGGFMGGCSRAWWRMTGRQTEADASGTTAGTTAGKTVGKAAVTGASASGVMGIVGAPRQSLFEEGYHDRIIKRPGMLENIKRYMADNPLRAMMRRTLPRLLERRLHLRIGQQDYAAFGCLFLLKRAEKEQVFYHRRDKTSGLPTEQTAAFLASRERQLNEARQGVVLVSPSISIPEQMVINAAIDERLPVINLQKEPIGPYWKPERHRFEACSRGTLLILAPWGIQDAYATDYARFHHLNDLAEEICSTTEVTLLDVASLTE